MPADFPAAHYRDPHYEKRMTDASEKLLAALWREHPRVLTHLTTARRAQP
jgi:hypothetical protein